MIHAKRFLLPLLMMVLCLSPLSDASSSNDGKYYALSPQEVIGYTKSSEQRKVIFIYASWCPHCRRAMPDLVALERQYPGTVFPVSVDTKPKAWAAYMDGYRDVPFHPVILKSEDPYGLEKAFGVPHRRGVPHYILLDGKNRVVKSANMRMRDVEKFIKKK